MDPVLNGNATDFEVSVKKTSSATTVHVSDLVLQLTRLGMTQNVKEAVQSKPEIALIGYKTDLSYLQRQLRLIVEGWQRIRNWLELYRQSCDSNQVPSPQSLERIYQLVTEAPHTGGFNTIILDLDRIMKKYDRLCREFDDEVVHIEEFLLIAQRQPLIQPLWKNLELELIGFMSKQLQNIGNPISSVHSLDKSSREQWANQIAIRFNALKLAGEVLEERAKIVHQIDAELRWVEWQTARQLVFLDDESAIDRLLNPDFREMMAVDLDACTKGLELAARRLRYDAVIAFRDILPFKASPSIHQWTAHAYVAQGNDVKALQELEAVKNIEWLPCTYGVAATALIRLGHHEEAVPIAKIAISHGWLERPEAPEMVDELVLTGSLVRDELLDFCNLVVDHCTSYSQAKLFESAYEQRIACLLDIQGVDPREVLDACASFTEMLTGKGETSDAWRIYCSFKPQIKDVIKLQWLDSLAADIPEALNEVKNIAWKSLSNSLIHEQAVEILKAYKSVPKEFRHDDALSSPDHIKIQPLSLLLAGATKSIRTQVRKRLVEEYGFPAHSIAEVASPWEGHTSTSEIRSLVNRHDLVVAYTSMMKHSLWEQLDVPSEKLVYPPSGGVSGSLAVILERCRQSMEAS
ncbi:hypothetical protein BXT84_10725 [Sulfobacillus thermotolerans]|uniref:DUF2325 domain-containing protein n=1 Tax=Sulfobacillus thermotolerans TaxID=338644 RepID=A0ABM6RSP7_9FIRM|nr:hypothetical protein BXT84_10725 [Sulfobacillus thermotolerans]